MEKIICRFQGYVIKRDDDGFFASAGSASFGYCDTLKEIKEEIADHNAEESAFYADSHGRRYDTPSIDNSFYENERC